MNHNSFILPKWGGAMVHSDPQLTNNINLPIPKDNIKIVWHKNELNGEKAGAKGNGIAGNGKIAACTFNGIKDNLVIYDYDGNHVWTSGEMLNAIAVSSSPMVSIHNEVIACDNKSIVMIKSHKDEYWVEWITDIPNEKKEGIIPFSPTIVIEKIVVLPTNKAVYAYDAQTGEFLAKKYLGLDTNNDQRFFSTINSAYIHKNRIYIATNSTKPADLPDGRLYALDVDIKSGDSNKTLTEAWYFPFNGIGQASPMFVDDTIYFDAYRPGLWSLKKPIIYALTDDDERYKVCSVEYPHRTLFNYSRDPRGGFWYHDLQGKKLVHFDDNLKIVEEIRMKDFVPHDILNRYKPMSCMTIFGEENPVMLTSAISLWPRQYLMAIDLNKLDSGTDDALLWNINMPGWNYAGGQFTILKKNNDPSKNRIVFGMYWDGVMAIGSVE